MHKRSSKKPDVHEIAASIVRAVETGSFPKTPDGKNPFAVALGRRGGKIGGKARAAAMSAERRREIAKAAAQSRWDNRIVE